MSLVTIIIMIFDSVRFGLDVMLHVLIEAEDRKREKIATKRNIT